ncbi:hypothetical protein HMPREF9080_00596 [Cardiobacterium valvarum F0432]|uniref:Uncharacterized protein n=1 Tax=Cardiobacterium valvarum F0432 TaxID=797473 RepID=G9ZCW7_9GAMM|nr:hypothetical protein HMPREF9080_00596 [Cardiobacterium valvarum F0432]
MQTYVSTAVDIGNSKIYIISFEQTGCLCYKSLQLIFVLLA